MDKKEKAPPAAKPANLTDNSCTQSKPNVLILGGCGFIGRNLVKYLVDNDLVNLIRVADKKLPIISNMNKEHSEAFKNKNVVNFVQADLSKDSFIKKIFEKDGHTWNYVVNLCGETRFGLSENEYIERSFQPARLAGLKAAEAKVDKFIEISTGGLYKPNSKPSTEESKLKPWTRMATTRKECETVLQNIDNLPLVILRPVNVYGEGDCTSVTPRAIGTAVYAENKWDLKYLWTKSLKINTVHVMDVCAAIWTACTSVPAGKVYNLADDSDTDQGKLNGILGEIFGIVPDYAGSFVSNIARMGLATVADSINDTMVPAWATLCQEHNVLNTPLSPYVDTELLYNNDMCVDGSLICRETAFTYSHPTLEKKELERILESFIAQKIFPDILHKQNTAVPSMASLSIVDRKEI